MKKLFLPLLALALLCPLADLAYAQDEDPAEVAIGERLFLETRFAQFFAQDSRGRSNRPLPVGDLTVATTETTGAPLPGPFAGLSMNCRSCHLVDEQLALDSLGRPVFTRPGGIRTYADFARRSPIPLREDGATHAPRNSPALVNASLERPDGLLLHFDGEFESLLALVRGTLTGRNYGWLASERTRAIAHIAHVIRLDDGSGALAQAFGGPYARVLAGTDPQIPTALRLPQKFRIDVRTASDDQIVTAISLLISEYVAQLEFQRDPQGHFIGSPFDRFLFLNRLPLQPRTGETAAAYVRRLSTAIDALRTTHFVSDADGRLALHDQGFDFGPEELAGLRIFLRRPQPGDAPGRTGTGNCVACHPAPFFTDFSLHNTGVTQVEYDGVHGDGAFAALQIPSRSERELHPDAYLPPTALHPSATGRFRAAAIAGRPELTDLGVWNVIGNKEFPMVQERLKLVLKHALAARLDDDQLQLVSIARFKTPGLRDLGHSGPYMHDGAFDTLDDVVELYRTTSDLQRAGELRNGAPELAGIRLSAGDVAPLAAFLRALNEDYN